ncbi:hypothetical protein HNY73_003826 [Argiope bruennichi]|uniref:Uncharacterized protein n=1 Tax=Argiope bruennichi TaxID=94029 RepID=A0A8T0FLW8_ARGBR|nr:hypothetical protein HNY73_003826 [Argiope bruennichi]
MDSVGHGDVGTPTISQQSSISGDPPPPTPDTEDTPSVMDLNDFYASSLSEESLPTPSGFTAHKAAVKTTYKNICSSLITLSLAFGFDMHDLTPSVVNLQRFRHDESPAHSTFHPHSPDS